MDHFNAIQSPEAQDLLNRLYRYSEVGHCVNCVTHDVNNYLGAVSAYAELVGLESEALNDEARRMLNEIVNAVAKCSSLLTAITEIAREERESSDIVDVAQLAQEVVDLRAYDLRTSRVDVATEHESNIPSVEADRPRLKLAFMYVIVNAMEALKGQQRDRRFRLFTRVDGDVIEVRMWNSAPPIPADEVEKYFEPFVTTKGEKHIGLGLAIARAVARQHHGDLTYDPEQGFLFHLPRRSRSRA